MEIVFNEASNLNRAVYGEILGPLHKFIETKAEAYEQQSLIPLLYNVEKSTHRTEVISGMTSMLGPKPVGEQGDYPNDGFQQGYDKTIIHKTWKDQFTVSREMMDDAQVLNIRKRPEAFLKAWDRTKETMAIRYFGEAMKNANAGKTKFSYDGDEFDIASADGVNLFSKAHPSKTGRKSNQSNYFADAFSAAALAELETRMNLFTDDNGNILNVAPATILIPADAGLKKTVFEVLGADKSPETANNGWNYLVGRYNVIVCPYLNAFVTNNDKPWILLDPSYNQSSVGSVWFDREALNFTVETAGNDNLVHKGRARWGVGFYDWRFCAIGGLTGGDTMIAA